MDDYVFEKLIEKSLSSLPKEFAKKLENVNVVVSDWPSPYQHRGRKGLLLGLYEGIPKTARGNRYGIGGAIPDKITIFKIPILMISRSAEDIKKNVKETVVHEIAHHFGLNEEAISKAKKG